MASILHARGYELKTGGGEQLHEIDLATLIEGILEQFLASDRFFQRRQRSIAAAPTDAEPRRS